MIWAESWKVKNMEKEYKLWYRLLDHTTAVACNTLGMSYKHATSWQCNWGFWRAFVEEGQHLWHNMRKLMWSVSKGWRDLIQSSILEQLTLLKDFSFVKKTWSVNKVIQVCRYRRVCTALVLCKSNLRSVFMALAHWNIMLSRVCNERTLGAILATNCSFPHIPSWVYCLKSPVLRPCVQLPFTHSFS